MPQPPDLRPFAFVLTVLNLDRNTAYFRDALGFTVGRPGRTDWQFVRKGSVSIKILPS